MTEPPASFAPLRLPHHQLSRQRDEDSRATATFPPCTRPARRGMHRILHPWMWPKTQRPCDAITDLSNAPADEQCPTGQAPFAPTTRPPPAPLGQRSADSQEDAVGGLKRSGSPPMRSIQADHRLPPSPQWLIPPPRPVLFATASSSPCEAAGFRPSAATPADIASPARTCPGSRCVPGRLCPARRT
jgi:hypothetical protein